MTMKRKTKKKKTRGSSSPCHTGVPDSSDFHTAVARIAVAQICKSAGYRGAQTSALETLTDVAVRYLQSLAKAAATSAGSTGRTQCNLLDIIFASEDLHSDIGFRGNSDPKRRLYSLTDSSILRDLMMFVNRTRKIPFAQSLPRCCHTLPVYPPCFSSESAKWNHIPRWLPSFPEITDGAEKTVAAAAVSEGGGEGETAWEKKMHLNDPDREISKLPVKRKKVSFKIAGDGGRRNATEMEFGVDLRSGICKGGKRISIHINDENHDSNSKQSMKMEFEEQSSRTKIVI